MSDRPAIDPAVGAMPDEAALPRRNGELVFEAPWQGRAFGLALAVVQRLGLPWSAFQRHLIAAIGERPGAPYYESWVEAVERLLREHDQASDAELDRAAAEVRRAHDAE